MTLPSKTIEDQAPAGGDESGHPGRGDEPAPPALKVTQDPEGKRWVQLSGVWNLRSLEPLLPGFEARLAQHKGEAAWDLSSVTAMDHAGALLL